MSTPAADDHPGSTRRSCASRPCLLDAVLIASLLLMGRAPWVAFSGRRGPTGLLMSAEEMLKVLDYGALTLVAFLVATAWNLFYRDIGCSPGRAWVRGEPPWERDLPWQHTLRGWFLALFIEFSFFTGWLITEVNLATFLTKFGKAWDIIRGLAAPLRRGPRPGADPARADGVPGLHGHRLRHPDRLRRLVPGRPQPDPRSPGLPPHLHASSARS